MVKNKYVSVRKMLLLPLPHQKKKKKKKKSLYTMLVHKKYGSMTS